MQLPRSGRSGRNWLLLVLYRRERRRGTPDGTCQPSKAGRPGHRIDTRDREVYGYGRVTTVDSQLVRLEFLQGTLEVLVLRSLQLGPNHAFGIARFIEQQSDREFTVDNGTLYPGLQRLLQKSWITSQWKTTPNGRRAKYYRLTADGRKQLVTATSRWQRFVEAMGRVLAPEAE